MTKHTVNNLVDSYPDEFRRLHWALFQPGTDLERVSVQITASRFTEGASSTALAFTKFVTELWDVDSVIAVEANFRNPCFGELLGISSGSSLNSALENVDKVFDNIEHSEIFNIHAIKADKSALVSKNQAVELLLENLGLVVDKLKQRYRLVVVDSPPMIPFSDARIISERVDRSLIVVEANTTKKQVLEFAINKTKSANTNILGLVLNKREFHIPKWVYKFI
ncbi:MAG: hypothetical protein PHS86_12765 [Syntrophaceae bacterium]|nr:hypothetical protein [Syntrophaceae bacterium]